MSDTTSLPVRLSISVTVEINGHATATELVAVAMPSTAGIDEITAAGLEMLAAQMNAGELSIGEDSNSDTPTTAEQTARETVHSVMAEEGYDDGMMVDIFTEFIEAENLTNKFRAYLAECEDATASDD